MGKVTISGYRLTLDDEDLDKIEGKHWSALRSKNGRVYFKFKGPDGSAIYLPRFLLDLKSKKDGYVDHINGNTLDNRRANLRICTNAQNMMNRGANSRNSSGFKGVSRAGHPTKWRAAIGVNYKTIILGFFNTPEEAHIAYCTAAKIDHGEFANTGGN